MPSPSDISLQNSLAQAARYLAGVDNIGVSDDPSDLYYLIDFLVFLVNQAYPQIPCQSGCAQCCIDSGLPRTSSVEWGHIYRYLRDTMPPETLQAVIAQNDAWHRPQRELFLQEQRRIEAPDTELPLPSFGCKQCPLLINNRCTVYPVRPAICRGFGSFTWRPGKDRDPQMFACQMAADALQAGLAEQGVEQAALPNWNAISDKVYQLNDVMAQGVMATLPLWLMVHTRDGQLLPLNRAPVFAADESA
ncbi:MAG: YkgJ family cysteine cluster protein [Candidatus Sericytochromatia bacterium]